MIDFIIRFLANQSLTRIEEFSLPNFEVKNSTKNFFDISNQIFIKIFQFNLSF